MLAFAKCACKRVHSSLFPLKDANFLLVFRETL